MSIRFHGLSGSPFSWKFLLAPEHKALTYDIQVLKADAGDLKRPEYPAIGQGDKAIEKCNVPGWRPNRPSNFRSPSKRGTLRSGYLTSAPTASYGTLPEVRRTARGRLRASAAPGELQTFDVAFRSAVILALSNCL
jgi:hypothetical protein